MKRVNSKFCAFLLGFFYVVLSCSPAVADDTEIYFGNSSNSGIANILFILDTSGSMSTDDDKNGTSRMDDLKTAFKGLMSTIQNANVGMMRFSDPGGPILYPVANIDKTVTDSSFGTVSSTIASGDNDGYQFNSTGQVVLNTNGLEIGAQAPSGVTIKSASSSVSAVENDADTNIDTATTRVSGWGANYLYSPSSANDGSNQHVVGVRFTGVAIPKGATIVRAYVQFETASVGLVDNNPWQIGIVGELSDRGVFDTSTSSPQTRILDTTNLLPTLWGVPAPITWSIEKASMPAVDDLVRTPDIRPIVQALVNSGGWGTTSGNVTLLYRKGTASLSNNWLAFSSYDRGTTPPKLVVDYYTGTAKTDSVTTALRFSNVNVPKGAAITSAKITFTAEGSDSSPIDITIKAEQSGNSAALSTSLNNITGRTMTSASVAWSGVPSWTSGQTYDTPDLSTLVGAVTGSTTSWCGGNAMTFVLTGSAGRRFAEAYEDGSITAPVLSIKYDPTTIPDGTTCRNVSQDVQVLAGSDDAEQYGSTTVVSDPSLELVALLQNNTYYAQRVGFRFNNIKIPQGSIITSAFLQLTANHSDSGTINLTINGQAADNPSTFTNSTNNISTRPLTTASVPWSPGAWSNGAVYTSPDVTGIVQELVNRSSWVNGNSMVMLISSTDSNSSSTSHRRIAKSYDASASKAPRLIITYQDKTAPKAQTVRDVLTSTTDTLNPAGYTPIQDTMYEAARYMRGLPVLYGAYRGGGPYAYTRVSHPNSYTGGVVYRPAGCTDANLSASACAGEVINGNPVYISPITSSCQVNHVVLLTDGLANHNHSDALVESMIGQSSCSDAGTGMACVQDLAGWMYNNDMSSSVAGKQNIITDTIAFNLTDTTATDFLKRVASSGGGKAYSATDAASLSAVFNNIVGQVVSQNTTFVSAGTAVNAFNRTINRDDLYFAVFRPDIKPKWPGNLKKYKLSAATSATPQVLDQNGANAVNANGFFADTAQSYWSAAVDGADVTKGGAGSLITDYTTRKVYTYLDDIASPNKALNVAANSVVSTNTNLTQAEMGVSGYTATQLSDLIDWTRGRDVLDENGNGSTSDTRFVFADPLHSRPVAITYGGTDTNPDITIFVTTNSGFLEAIDNSNGAEKFAFLPKDLLPLQQILYTNSSTDAHPYGLDGSITYWIKDPENDGVVLDASNNIQPGNSVNIVFGMRRGGRNYYALDVTDRANPKISWVIKGGVTAGFNNLGQTWSQPVKTKVNVGGTIHDALIFSGGYDANQDSSKVRDTNATDSMGNAIYIVDATDGSLLWSGSNQVDATTVFSDMKYSMPATVNVADINGDGLADMVFVGDTGGQVWRFDIHNGSAAGSLVTGGVIADLNAGTGTATASNNRRFYHSPALVYGVNNGTPYLGVLIGSGWRAHPLNTATDDQFFMIRQTNIYSAPSTYTKVTEADLFDASSNVIGEGTAAAQTAALTQLQAAAGWFITLPNAGEKVLSTPLVLEGQVYFDTYQPGSAPSSDPCAPSTGINRAYVVSATDATPVYNFDGGPMQAGDRSYILNTPGIVDQPRVVAQKGRLVIMQGPLTSVGPSNLLNEIHRNYWIEKR